MHLVGHLYRANAADALPADAVRWVAPSLAAQLRDAYARYGGRSLSDATTGAADLADDAPPLDLTVVRLLRLAERVEPWGTTLNASPFAAFARDLLERPTGPSVRLVLATIHGAKGAEYDHVILHQYNLLGDGQGRNVGAVIHTELPPATPISCTSR